MTVLPERPLPVVLAPLAGGPSTPELAAEVTDAGGLGTLAFGYLSAVDAADRRTALRRPTAGPFGVNLFGPGVPSGDAAGGAACGEPPTRTRRCDGTGHGPVRR